MPTSTQMVHLRTMKTTLYVSYCTRFIKLLRLPPNSLHACEHRLIYALNLHTSINLTYMARCVCTYIGSKMFVCTKCMVKCKFCSCHFVFCHRFRASVLGLYHVCACSPACLDFFSCIIPATL